jgi:hypothetical protein
VAGDCGFIILPRFRFSGVLLVEFCSIIINLIVGLASNPKTMNIRKPLVEMESPRKSLQLAIQSPGNRQFKIHAHLTSFTTSIILFLSSSSDGEVEGHPPMGSFVCAMPNVTRFLPLKDQSTKSLQRLDRQHVLSTALYSSETTIDYANRVAKILAHRMNLPVYVGCSVNLLGSNIEEEMESLGELTKVIMAKWDQGLQT